MDSLLKAFPKLPNDTVSSLQDPWKIAILYDEYLIHAAELGRNGWASGHDNQRGKILALLAEQHAECQRSNRPWAPLLSRYLERLHEIFEKYEDLTAGDQGEENQFSQAGQSITQKATQKPKKRAGEYLRSETYFSGRPSDSRKLS
tara:strand:- start:46 stop:483 length:438 start_codon:yes stop_codon:yes gene_type:complete